MADVIQFHPPVGDVKIIRHPEVDGEYLVNIPGVVQILRDGETEKARSVYAAYLAEWHALSGQPLSGEARQEVAFRAAAKRHGFNLVSK